MNTSSTLSDWNRECLVSCVTYFLYGVFVRKWSLFCGREDVGLWSDDWWGRPRCSSAVCGVLSYHHHSDDLTNCALYIWNTRRVVNSGLCRCLQMLVGEWLLSWWHGESFGCSLWNGSLHYGRLLSVMLWRLLSPRLLSPPSRYDACCRYVVDASALKEEGSSSQRVSSQRASA